MKNKAIFADRDGVINQVTPEKYVISWEDFHFLPGIAEAIKKLKQMDFLIILITNQFGIAKGFATLEDIENIHNKMQEELMRQGTCFDAIYMCPDDSECRKPKLGMFKQAIEDWNIDVSKSYVIGDAVCDMIAAEKLGCKFIMVRSALSPIIVENLLEASKIIEKEGDKK